MEKYAKLMKGLEMCAGPECCKDGCPYYGETTGGMTCRARLLMDASVAINNEHAVRGATEAELQGAKETMEAMEAEYRAERKRYGELFALNKALEEDARSVRAHRDAIAEDRAKITVERDKLRKECDMLHERCQVQQNEINALLLKMGKQDGKTDRPSVCDKELAEKIGKLINRASYHEGRADALAEIVERCSFGGGGRHE